MTTAPETDGVMTARERTELATLIRQRERVAKTEVKQRAARLRADAELEMTTIFAAEDALWADLVTLAQEGIQEVNARLAQRAHDVKAPRAMGYPQVDLGWNVADSAYQNRGRRGEIRRMIDSRLADVEATAKAQIEQRSLAAQTEVMAGGLTSDAARAVLASLPTVEALMPAIDLGALDLVMPGLSEGKIAATVAAIQGVDLAALRAARPPAALTDGADDDDDDGRPESGPTAVGPASLAARDFWPRDFVTLTCAPDRGLAMMSDEAPGFLERLALLVDMEASGARAAHLRAVRHQSPIALGAQRRTEPSPWKGRRSSVDSAFAAADMALSADLAARITSDQVRSLIALDDPNWQRPEAVARWLWYPVLLDFLPYWEQLEPDVQARRIAEAEAEGGVERVAGLLSDGLLAACEEDGDDLEDAAEIAALASRIADYMTPMVAAIVYQGCIGQAAEGIARDFLDRAEADGTVWRCVTPGCDVAGWTDRLPRPVSGLCSACEAAAAGPTEGPA